jgi:hypothetical protein
VSDRKLHKNRYGVRVIVGADVGHPIEGWAKGGKNLTHEGAVALADGLRERGYVAFIKPYDMTGLP